MDKISIVIPCFNEQEAIPVYYREMAKVMERMKETAFELIFVDDGSRDGTLAELRKLSRQDQRCRYLSFSRNFGKEAAIYGGLSVTSGDYAVVMDVDLQDPPELIPRMYQMLQKEDCDCVATRRADREGEPKLRSFLSDSFYRVINRISQTQIVRGARDYRMMKRKMVNAVLSMSEYNRFSKGIFQWVGFRTEWLEFPNTQRVAGETKWTLGKLARYALEGILGFSTAPLSIAAVAGGVFFIISLLMGVDHAVRVWILGQKVSGWVILLCVVFLVGGIQLLCLGIMGQYLSKTYMETKHRPLYILKESSEETAKIEEKKAASAVSSSANITDAEPRLPKEKKITAAEEGNRGWNAPKQGGRCTEGRKASAPRERIA